MKRWRSCSAVPRGGVYRIIEASAKEFVHSDYFKDVARHACLDAVGGGGTERLLSSREVDCKKLLNSSGEYPSRGNSYFL